MEVRFRNFRCFRDTRRIPIRPVTLLVGENSSGKTSFLAGLNHMFGLMRGVHTIDLNTPPFELGAMAEIVYSKDVTKVGKKSFKYECHQSNSLSFVWEFSGDLGDPRLTGQEIGFNSNLRRVRCRKSDRIFRVDISLSQTELVEFTKRGGIADKITNSQDLYRISTASLNPAARKRVLQHTIFHPFTILNHFRLGRMCDDLLSLQTSEASDSFHRTVSQVKPKPSLWWENLGDELAEQIWNASGRRRNARAFAPLREKPKRAYFFGKTGSEAADPYSSQTLVKMMNLTQDRQIQSFVKSAIEDFGKSAGLFQELEFVSLTDESNYPFAIKVRAIGERFSNLTDVGYGTSQILPLLLDIVTLGNVTDFLIQQPEVHLHPRAQAEFASLIATLAGRRRSFVVETHSDYILDRLTHEIKASTVSAKDVVILYFEKTKDQVRVYPIDLNEHGIPIDPPPSYRDFFDTEFERVWL